MINQKFHAKLLKFTGNNCTPSTETLQFINLSSLYKEIKETIIYFWRQKQQKISIYIKNLIKRKWIVFYPPHFSCDFGILYNKYLTFGKMIICMHFRLSLHCTKCLTIFVHNIYEKTILLWILFRNIHTSPTRWKFNL